MKAVKKTEEFTIFKRADGRHAVKSANKTWISGDEKVAILLAAGLITQPKSKPAEPVAEDSPEEAPAADSAEAE